MIFNETVIGDHPATAGYIVECFVKGSEVISADSSLGFPSGSGRLKIEFPEFAITGLEFEGKNLLFTPTGETDLEKLLDNIEILENEINLKVSFSGDLDLNNTDSDGNLVSDNLAIKNIKKLDVYSGEESNFDPDSISFTNRVGRFPVNLSSGENEFSINIESGQIDDRVEENIFYKVIPNDFLTFGDVSPVTSGVMFSGFETFTKINTGEFIITRSNANDLVVSRGQTVEIFTGTNIVIDDTLPLDFYAMFKMGTTEALTISGSGGAVLASSSSQFTVDAGQNKIDVPANNEFAEFDIACLLDENDVRTGYLIGEL